MNIERKEMEKTDEQKLLDTFKRVSELEKTLRDLDKDELINLFISKFFIDEQVSFEPVEKTISLWCYMDPETKTRYLTDEHPKMLVREPPERPIVWSDGEINIRVPQKMESMLPEMTTEDGIPLKINLTISF